MVLQTIIFSANNPGQILYLNVTNGSSVDIQTAINSLGSDGGTIYIPAGTYTFNPPTNGVGVTIPFNKPINIIGAGIGQTILKETLDSGNSKMFKRSWSGETTSGAKLRISGISFQGYVTADTQTNVGIELTCSKDFRIDHCSFTDFANCGVFVSDNTGGTYKLVSSGVIDHCTFDNPYKDNFLPHNPNASTWSVWGYGVIIVGDYYTWDPTISDYLGHYTQYTTYNGAPIPNSAIYIEDCSFSRMRHAVSSNGNGWYVVRNCHFDRPAAYGQCDVHGNAGNGVGGRGLEVYNNVFDFTDDSYSGGQESAVEMRGGGGVVYNNTIIMPSTGGGYGACSLTNDGEVAPYDVRSFYWWNNVVTYPNGSNFTPQVKNLYGGYSENVNYFLRAPSQSLDGFSYTAYQYPHPLTAD